MMIDYPWPAPPGTLQQPIWTGRGFAVGQDTYKVLCYRVTASGWSDELTEFHEDTAGANHPIDLASRREALAQLGRHIRGESPLILEVGCSSGFMLKEIRRHFPETGLIGADFVRGPLEQLAQEVPELPLLQFDLTDCPLPDTSLDAVVLLNVLEHIARDDLAVRQVHRILKPGGVAIIEVPAGPHLYDLYDRMLMHHRRYKLASLCKMLRSAGFSIVRKSHLGCLPYPAFRLVKWWNKRLAGQSATQQTARVSRNIRGTTRSPLLAAALRLEGFLGRCISYPAGIRCLVTARRA
jgi:SAM-dependent methyltransferase